MMYALERLVFLKTGRCLRYCWQQYAVSANRPLLEKVRAGQKQPEDWRVTAMPMSEKGRFEMAVQAKNRQPAA